MTGNQWARLALVAVTGTALAACAIRLGGARPVAYETIGLDVASAAGPAEIGERIRAARPDVVFLGGPADSAWFGGVAAAAGMQLSGPGIRAGAGLAFLAGEALGDTTVVLGTDVDGGLMVHDALYRVDRHRYLNLLALNVDSAEQVRPAVRALLDYVATDVMHNASVVMAVRVPDVSVGDSLATLLSPAFHDGLGCLPADAAPPSAVPMRFFYGPELRVRCDRARILEGEDRAFQARFVLPG